MSKNPFIPTPEQSALNSIELDGAHSPLHSVDRVPSAVGPADTFREKVEKSLDFERGLVDLHLSMPAEPLGSLGNQTLNSGGFFYARMQGGTGGKP